MYVDSSRTVLEHVHVYVHVYVHAYAHVYMYVQCACEMYGESMQPKLTLTSLTKFGDISGHRDGEKLLPSAVTTVVNTLSSRKFNKD